MNFDYTRLTHEQLLEDWNNRILADERFKGLTQASIYQYFQEMIAGISDLSTFYLGRVAEESFIDTAKLDSSIIKLSKNYGYRPRRAIPAKAEIKIQIHGPLPKQLKAGHIVWFNNEQMKFSFDNHNFLMDYSYSYKFTENDIANGQDASWSKTISFAKNSSAGQDQYIEIDDRTTLISKKNLFPIKIFQGTIKTEVIEASTNADKVGTANQWFDIDDTSFSNFYGKRDPYAYVGGEYNPNYGLCKVGIGSTEEEALSNNNVFSIEEYVIEINEGLKTWKPEQDPLKICLIETNTDKTVRLFFGNGNSVVAGFKNIKEKLFVRYLSCDGSSTNKYGTTESQLNCTNKIYATGNGAAINLTNNIKFLFNSDITSGSDFESIESMKISAKLFNASNGNILTLQDFTSYFRTLINPLNVNHAIAFGENQYNENNKGQPWLMNNVCYTLFGDIYHNYDTGNYEPINVFDDNEKLNDIMLYTTKQIYLDHLFDLLKLRLYPKTLKERQYKDLSEFGVNAKMIRDDCSDKMLLNTNLISIPPIFHYYDIVGDVLVDKHKDLVSYKTEIEDSIYSWLNTNITFKTKIYKSDISKKLFENEATKRTNLDIKVSSIVAENAKVHEYLNIDTQWSYDTNNASSKYWDFMGSKPQIGWMYYNQLRIPKRDVYGVELGDARQLIGKQIKIEYDIRRYGSDTISNHTAFTPNQWITITDCTSDDDFYYINIAGDGISYAYETTPNKGVNSFLRIYKNIDSFSSDGNANALTQSFKDNISRWLTSKVNKVGTTERPIELPYIIDAIRTNVRTETLSRRGANDVSLNGLNENSFNDWAYRYLRNRIENDSPIESFRSSGMESDMKNVYPLLKPAFSDSILDDNNNIVNFSCEQEIPVLRVKLNYKYEE